MDTRISRYWLQSITGTRQTHAHQTLLLSVALWPGWIALKLPPPLLNHGGVWRGTLIVEARVLVFTSERNVCFPMLRLTVAGAVRRCSCVVETRMRVRALSYAICVNVSDYLPR